jgi:SAM-dependent methyltransferase
MSHTAPLDFAAAWQSYVSERDTSRLDAEHDRAFWERFAPHYDLRTASPGSRAQTLTVLSGLVRIGDTLLDVGAGTGRFALPLARCVSQVTALDHSAAMLNILRRKATVQGVENITIQETDWESAEVEPHDVVLAAWSLYRQPDLCAALHRLVAATRRTLIVVAGDATAPPHRASLDAIWGQAGRPKIPEYLYLLGSLWQIGVRANVRVVHETRHFSYVTPVEAAEQLAPVHAAPEEIQQFAREMVPLLERRSDGWHYIYRLPVGVLIWRRGT